MTTAVLRHWMPRSTTKKTMRAAAMLAGLLLTSAIVNAAIILADGKIGIPAY